MSRFTDWFLADPSEAAELANALPEELAEGWQHISLEDVLELEIEELSKVLCGPKVPYRAELLFPEDAAKDDGPSVTSEVMEAGVFVMRVPDTLVQALASMGDEACASVAASWRNRAEHLRGRPAHETTEMLAEMCRFARRAVEKRKAVLNVFEA